MNERKEYYNKAVYWIAGLAGVFVFIYGYVGIAVLMGVIQ